MRVSSFGRYVMLYDILLRCDEERGLFVVGWRVESWENLWANGLVLQYHNESVLKKYAPKLKVGEIKEEAKL
jgi:hypothetical protein